MVNVVERDDSFLAERLDFLWETYFSDIERLNKVHIKFGRKCFKRLGTIRGTNHTKDGFDTLIYLNGHFKCLTVPLFVLDATIVHELAHYVHGISSPYPRLFKYPHRGGLVDKELALRGLEPLVATEAMWLKDNWRSIAAPRSRITATEISQIPVAVSTSSDYMSSNMLSVSDIL